MIQRIAAYWQGSNPHLVYGLGIRPKDSCGVPGCDKDHRLHHCRNCGAQNNHKTSRCPMGCGVPGCNERHRVHNCRNCGAKNRHRTRDCPRKRKSCGVFGCSENHTIHICGVCGVRNNHRTRNCPSARSTRGYGVTTASGSSGPRMVGRVGTAPSSGGVVLPGGFHPGGIFLPGGFPPGGVILPGVNITPYSRDSFR